MDQKPDAQFLRALRTEAARWLAEGIIDADQKKRILSQYGELEAPVGSVVKPGPAATRQRYAATTRGEKAEPANEKAVPAKLIATVSVLGSILIGVGILLFVGSNWSHIPNAGRLAIIFSALLGAYGTGFYLRHERETYPRVGAALILLGSLVFGAGIFLIAQMYHISVHYPNGPLLWGLSVLPLAYLLGLKPLLSLAIIDLLVWLGMEASFSEYALFNSFTVFLALFLMAGIALWSLGLMHRGFPALQHLSGPYLGLGLFLSLLTGYILTFEFMQWHVGAPALRSFYIGLSVLFLFSLAFFILKGEKDGTWIPEVVFLGALFLLVLLFTVTSPAVEDPSGRGYAYDYARGRSYNAMRLGFNLLYALQIIGVIVLGYFRRNRAYINLGLVFFTLEVIARYFDMFWKLLPRSLFFIGGGLLLMLGGMALEKKRRKVLATFTGEGA